MVRPFLYFALLLSFLAVSGCEQPTSLQLNAPDAKLVVVSNFTQNQAVQVFVSKSQFILSQEEQESVTDAKVEIYEGNVFLERLELVSPTPNMNAVPYYTTRNLVPEVNTTYTIQVEASCCAPVTARNTIPRPIGFLSTRVLDFSLEEIPETGAYQANYRVELSFEDPSEEENFYHISLLQQVHSYTMNERDTIITGTHYRSLVFNPEDNSNGRVAHINGGLLLEDNILNDGEVIRFEVPLSISLQKEEELLGKLFLELRAVTEAYFRYFSDVSQQSQSSGSPFSEPVIIYDNIEGGLGVFAGYNSSVDSLYLQ